MKFIGARVSAARCERDEDPWLKLVDATTGLVAAASSPEREETAEAPYSAAEPVSQQPPPLQGLPVPCLPVVCLAEGERVLAAIRSKGDPCAPTPALEVDDIALLVIRFVLRVKTPAGWYVYGGILRDWIIRGHCFTDIDVACNAIDPVVAARDVEVWAQSLGIPTSTTSRLGNDTARIELGVVGKRVIVELNRSSHFMTLDTGAEFSCNNLKLSGCDGTISLLYVGDENGTLEGNSADCSAGIARVFGDSTTKRRRARILKMTDKGWDMRGPDGRPQEPPPPQRKRLHRHASLAPHRLSQLRVFPAAAALAKATDSDVAPDLGCASNSATESSVDAPLSSEVAPPVLAQRQSPGTDMAKDIMRLLDASWGADPSTKYTSDFRVPRAWPSSETIFGYHQGATAADVAAATALCSSRRQLKCSRCPDYINAITHHWARHVKKHSDADWGAAKKKPSVALAVGSPRATGSAVSLSVERMHSVLAGASRATPDATHRSAIPAVVPIELSTATKRPHSTAFPLGLLLAPPPAARSPLVVKAPAVLDEARTPASSQGIASLDGLAISLGKTVVVQGAITAANRITSWSVADAPVLIRAQAPPARASALNAGGDSKVAGLGLGLGLGRSVGLGLGIRLEAALAAQCDWDSDIVQSRAAPPSVVGVPGVSQPATLSVAHTPLGRRDPPLPQVFRVPNHPPLSSSVDLLQPSGRDRISVEPSLAQAGLPMHSMAATKRPHGTAFPSRLPFASSPAARSPFVVNASAALGEARTPASTQGRASLGGPVLALGRAAVVQGDVAAAHPITSRSAADAPVLTRAQATPARPSTRNAGPGGDNKVADLGLGLGLGLSRSLGLGLRLEAALAAQRDWDSDIVPSAAGIPGFAQPVTLSAAHTPPGRRGPPLPHVVRVSNHPPVSCSVDLLQPRVPLGTTRVVGLLVPTAAEPLPSLALSHTSVHLPDTAVSVSNGVFSTFTFSTSK